MVIMEALRLYGPAAFTMRACAEDYCLPGTDFTVRKNDMLLFPNEAFHRCHLGEFILNELYKMFNLGWRFFNWEGGDECLISFHRQGSKALVSP